MEGDAGTSQLNPTDADETPDESLAVSEEDQPEQATDLEAQEPADDESVGGDRRPSRLGVGWVATICAALLVLAAGAAAGGYLALRSHRDSEAIGRADAAALQAAKDCVAATNAPDTSAMTAAQSKIIECSTGDFGAQAALYSSVLVDAYQAANVKVAVSDMRAAVERHNADGSVDVLVAVRVKVTNSEQADQEQGYRLRVQMAPDAGTYKIARLDQVST
ncbi:MAG: Mce-associated rane protein [Mycobacterium sp.]|jgi:Mce-associated membrane protein|nr:Mce-associated rane protein [Mycobacterium sp.]MDT5333198.1 Mce-associated rane protein [Mycobacterium sp.]